MVDRKNIKCKNCLKHFELFESWETKALEKFEKTCNPTHEEGQKPCSYSFQRKAGETPCKECGGKVKTNQEGDIEECRTCEASRNLPHCEKCQKISQSGKPGKDGWNFCTKCLSEKTIEGNCKKRNCPICKKIICWNNLNAVIVVSIGGIGPNSEDHKNEEWEWIDGTWWQRSGSCCSQECNQKSEEESGGEKHTCPGCKQKYGIYIGESVFEGDKFKTLHGFISHHKSSNKCFWNAPEIKQKVKEYRNKFGKWFDYSNNPNDFSIKRSSLTLAELQECKREILALPPVDDLVCLRAFCFKESDNYDVEVRGMPWKDYLVEEINKSIKKKQEEGDNQPNSPPPPPPPKNFFTLNTYPLSKMF